MSNPTDTAAAEQTNAAFREAVERRAALRAEVEAEQLPPSSLCRLCEEPLALLEMREQLCSECESDENERMSRDYEMERAADAPYHGRR